MLDGLEHHDAERDGSESDETESPARLFAETLADGGKKECNATAHAKDRRGKKLDGRSYRTAGTASLVPTRRRADGAVTTIERWSAFRDSSPEITDVVEYAGG